MLTHLFFLCFAVHPLSNLFDLMMKVDGSMYLYFHVLALLISRKNILERLALILGEDLHTFTTDLGQQLLIQDGPFSCKLVLLSLTHIENYISASADISLLLGLWIRYLKITGKGTSPVRSRILPSPILFKEMTSTKNPCSLDDLLVGKSSIKWRIMTLWGGRPFVFSWSGGIRVTLHIPTSRTAIILKSERRSTVLDVKQRVTCFWSKG